MYKTGDIIQITDKEHHWYPCLVIVSEPKNWGIQGYITIPKDNMGDIGNAYIRLKNSQIEKCGHAILVAD